MPNGALILGMMLLFRYLFIIHGIILQRSKKKTGICTFSTSWPTSFRVLASSHNICLSQSNFLPFLLVVVIELSCILCSNKTFFSPIAQGNNHIVISG